MLNIRLRPGTANESTRVVHAAARMTDGTLMSLCGMIFDPALVEESHGMPCMRCVQITIQLAARADLPMPEGKTEEIPTETPQAPPRTSTGGDPRWSVQLRRDHR